MSTRAEIEAAIETLSADEQRALLQFISERVHRLDATADDPVQAIIGTFRSKNGGGIGRRAQDILYGHDEE